MPFMFKWLRSKGIGCIIRPETVGSRLVCISCFLDTLRAGILLLESLSSRLIDEQINRRGEWAHSITAMPYFFRDARLGAVVLARESRVVGQIVRELNLRKHTGAIIIGIERQGIMIINPEADETFQPADRVMLLGTGGQIENARAWLCEDSVCDPGAGR